MTSCGDPLVISTLNTLILSDPPLVCDLARDWF